jgi:hypothetical protein
MLLFKNGAPTNGAVPTPGSGDAQQDEKVLLLY